MKKLLLLLCSGMAYAQVTIPDENFRNLLLSSNSTTNQVAYNAEGNYFAVDVNDNDQIETEEALLVYELRIENENISSLAGIEHFTNLRGLFAMQNINLGSVDLSALTNLEIASLGQNEITSLNVTGLTQLHTLDLFGNSLTTLDISTLINLEVLDTFENYTLATVNWGDINSLKRLLIGNNPITELNLENFSDLIQFECIDTNVVTLDVSNNPEIGIMIISNNSDLTSINLKNNDAGTYFLNANPNLEFVCADDERVAEFEDYFDDLAQDVTVSSNCSLDVAQNHKSQFNIYPNPASEFINIQSDSTILFVELHGIDGRLLQSSKFNAQSVMLDVSLSPTGLYLVNIVSEKGSVIRKIIKQ